MAFLRIVVPLALLVCVAAKDEGVKIEKSPATVKTREFNRNRPPAEMPKLKKNEAAITHSNFGCGALVEASVKETSSEGGKHVAMIEVKKVKVTLSLDITIWLPKNVTEKIRAHEEGHRQIDEHYYKSADEIAQSIARVAIGKTYSAEGKTEDEAADNAIKRAGDEINGQYMDAVQKPASRAQELFDEITDHGRNAVTEKDAIERAIKRADEARK